MALITNNIYEARSAYSSLELLAQASQQNVVTLQATVDNLTAIHAQLVDSVRLQGEFTASQISTNGQLTAQQATAVSPDISLDNFIAALGLSIALAEATMPDRAISGVQASVQSYLTFAPDPNGVMVPGLRLYQPELGEPTALATTSFELAKTVSAGAPAPRSLYTVLQAKQTTFADPFWTKFTSGNPATQPAVSIVAEVGTGFLDDRQLVVSISAAGGVDDRGTGNDAGRLVDGCHAGERCRGLHGVGAGAYFAYPDARRPICACGGRPVCAGRSARCND